MARRQVRRTWVSSLLIATLVALPIAGLTAAAVFVDSMMASPAERVRADLGRMQAWVEPAGIPDAGFWQSPVDPYWTGYPRTESGSWIEPEGDIPADPVSALPAGTRTVPIAEGRVRIETVGGVAAARAWAGSVGDPRFAGRFDLVTGEAPRAADEVLATEATLERAGIRVGGLLIDADVDREYTVTGTIDIAGVPDSESALAFGPDFDPSGERLGKVRWYLPDLSLDWPAVQELNAQGVVAYARDVVLDPPPFEIDGYTLTDPETQELLNRLILAATLGAAGVAAGYMVVMLAGAAFSVSARRQQRALAIAASVGADARDLRRTVRLQGTVLGIVGGVTGVALGVGVAAIAMRLTDNGSGTMFWGFHVPWPLLAGILLFAVVVGTAAALMPARGVARSDAMSALRGARRPQKVSVARPLWGSLMLLVGVAVTIACGLAAAAVVTSEVIPYDSPLRWLPSVGIIVGPIIAQLGIVLSGRWLLGLVSRGLSRLGIAARIASRDAVANGARTVPAFAAIGATVFVGVFAVGMGGMVTGQTARSWTYSAPVGVAVSSLYSMDGSPLTPAQADEAAAAAVDVLDRVGVASTAVVQRQQEVWEESVTDIPADRERAVAVVPERSLLDPESTTGLSFSQLDDPRNNLAVIAADDLETVTGVRLSAGQRAAYDAGAAFVTDSGLVTDGTVEIAAWTEREWQYEGAPSNIYTAWPGEEIAEPQWSETVDAVVVSAPEQPVRVAISPATADALGVDALPQTVFGAFDAPPTTEQVDRLAALTDDPTSEEYASSTWIESGPLGADSWLIPLLVAVAVLVVGASAVALGLARFERRPDDATLTAVGGTDALRRRIGFWQGLVIVGFGTFAGAVAGILPPIGFMLQSQAASDRAMFLTDIPWGMLAVLAFALPLVIAAANAVIPPRRPDLTRRTAIA